MKRAAVVAWLVGLCACGSSTFSPGAPDASNGGDATSTDAPADGIIAINPEAGPSDASPSTDASGDAGCSAPTTLDCNGTCVDPTLPAHCGTCTNVCEGPDSGSGGPTCTNGTCTVGCDADGSTPLNCGGACVDPTQTAHCGSCTNACPGPDAGTGAAQCNVGDGGLGTPGTCSVLCNGSTTLVCGDSCFDPATAAHCGSCGNVCPGPPSGNGSAGCPTPPTCTVACNANYHVCSADCLSNSDTPSVTTDPCIINEAFGIFVSPTGSDSAAGTQLAPVATVGKAMDLAKTAGKRVYACGSAGNYTENLALTATRDGVNVYGGLDCTTSPSQWAYNASDKATIAPASGYALQITGLATGVSFADFGFVAANATGVGASSIAVFAANSSGVAMSRCTLTAGLGTTGQGGTPVGQAAHAPSGNAGGGSKSSGGTGAGGPEQPNPSCTTSIGGAGGSDVAGQVDGQPGDPNGNNAGTSADCNLVPSQGGGTGGSGGPGNDNAGASTWAAFSASGWTPSGGQTGSPGGVGVGGGGGGAGAAANVIGGGGGGGAGGCGGAGGSPGAGGGSSIALLTYDSTVALNACILASASAGAGGGGAAGQPGQAGGSGGAAGTASCAGGAGGTGGTGGAGGGGAGGVSAGVVWTGTTPTITGGSQTPGTAGAGGSGGNGLACTTSGNNCGIVGSAAGVLQGP